MITIPMAIIDGLAAITACHAVSETRMFLLLPLLCRVMRGEQGRLRVVASPGDSEFGV